MSSKLTEKCQTKQYYFILKFLCLQSKSTSFGATWSRDNLLLVKVEAIIPRHGTLLTAL